MFKIFNKRVKGFKYVPVDLMNMHTVSLLMLAQARMARCCRPAWCC